MYIYWMSAFGSTRDISFQIAPTYPREAPKVKCKIKVHKNTQLFGWFCLLFWTYYFNDIPSKC